MIRVYPGANYFQSPNWGYPYTRNPRRIKPTILAVIHIADSMSSAESQTRWGFDHFKSWTFMLDRDGGPVQSLDPTTQTPWTNGDVNGPDTSNPNIAAMDLGKYNFNEYCFLTIENVGLPFSDPVNAAQIATIRGILAWGTRLSGIPATRDTVIGHYQINSATRVNCPAIPAQRAALFDAILGGTLPDTALPEGPMPDIIRVNPASRAVIHAGVEVSREPHFRKDGDPEDFTRTFGGERKPLAPYVVEGEAYKVTDGTSNEWLEIAPTEAGQKVRYYIPAVNATLRDITPEAVEECQAALTKEHTRANAIQSEALKSLKGQEVAASSAAERIRGM